MRALRRRLVVPLILVALLGATAAVVLVTTGGDEPSSPRATTPVTTAPAPPPPPDPLTLSIGLTEQNPALFGGDVPLEFVDWRDRTVALKPQVYRLLVDWSKLQPNVGAPPDFAYAQDGCLRGRGPCAPYAGIRDILKAVKARQASDGGWRVMAVLYGAPDWAKAPAAGCPEGGTIDRVAYQNVLRGLVQVMAEEGVELAYLAPWNEPNHPTFLAPQRSACDREAPALSPAAYAELVRAAREVAPRTPLVLGELAGYDRARTEEVGAAEFAAALPKDVVCASTLWGQHAYVGSGRSALAADRQKDGHAALLARMKTVLDAFACPQAHRLWITETGARPDAESCAQMDEALRAWDRDARVDVAVQYTFRQDTLFRVGLADARLTRTLPAYAAWLAWGGTRDPAGPAPTEPCAAAAAG